MMKKLINKKYKIFSPIFLSILSSFLGIVFYFFRYDDFFESSIFDRFLFFFLSFLLIYLPDYLINSVKYIIVSNDDVIKVVTPISKIEIDNKNNFFRIGKKEDIENYNMFELFKNGKRRLIIKIENFSQSDAIYLKSKIKLVKWSGRTIYKTPIDQSLFINQINEIS